MAKTTRNAGLEKQQANGFSIDDVLADFAAAYRLLEARGLDQHAGQYVAVLRGEVAGAGLDAATLRETVSCTHGVHPERVAIIRVVNEATVYG
jgi:hypothetical protein